jgi:tetratricopeptide (TPR) repeat protein
LSAPKGPSEDEYVLTQVNEIIARFVSAICAKPIGFEEIRGTGPNWDLHVERSASEGLSIAGVFSDFRSRLVAGEALESAKTFASENRLAEAAAQYEIAVKKAPDDVEVLLAFGVFLFSHGNAVGAEKMIGRAVKLQPESAHGLNYHAIALNAAGRRDEAIETFRKLLRVDPKFRDAYPRLAFLLFQARRPEDSLDLLNQALAMWPDFAEAGKLREQIRKASGFN